MDDALALELGLTIHGSVANVYVNSDGYKKSIPGPGVGNYVTVAKAMSLARRLIGDEGLRQRTYFQAHGTSTPQNRVTESHIMSALAGVFGIENWLVGAVKGVRRSFACARRRRSAGRDRGRVAPRLDSRYHDHRPHRRRRAPRTPALLDEARRNRSDEDGRRVHQFEGFRRQQRDRADPARPPSRAKCSHKSTAPPR